jgi:glycosyl hydrolase family 42 (putative beta-galactosidase)
MSFVRAGVAAIVLSALATSASPPAAGRAVALPPAGGINAEPSMRPWRYAGANPDGWWCRPPNCRGVRNGTAFVERELPLVARLGVETLRLEFPWPLLEPRRGAFDWRRADYILRKASSAGIEVQPVLVYSPAWAAQSASSPPRATDFSRFVRRFARRYRRSIDYYELWNEPNSARYWEGSQPSYVMNVLVPGYRAVKTVDPRAKVLLGGPTSADIGWLHGIYSNGGGRFFDVLAYHDYTGDPTELTPHAVAVQGVLEAHGQRHKPIWLGEYGIQEPQLADVHQQRLMLAALTESTPLAVAQWYSLRDDFPSTCCPPARVKSEFYGLMTHDYVPKRGYELMRELLAERRTTDSRGQAPRTRS